MAHLPLVDPHLVEAPTAPSPLMFEIHEKSELRQCYMPVFAHGGLFITIDRPLPPRSKVLLILQLPGGEKRHTVSGVVGYRSPQNAGAHSPTGIGLAFDDNELNRELKAEIERMLSGMPADGRVLAF
jgi:type IV pilus assembly protein PilZ